MCAGGMHVCVWARAVSVQMSGYVGQIDGAIQGHIGENRDQLLGGMGGIHELQRDCEALGSTIGDVKRSVHRISSTLGAPFGP